MNSHAKYSPSKLPFLALCAGWQSDPTPGPQAMRGTAIHGWLAQAVSESDPIKRQALLRTVPAELHVPVGEGMALWSDLRARFPDHSWSAEVPLDTGIPDVYGTADLVGMSEWSPVAVLVDWKTGRGERDDSGTSLQCAAYAIGLVKRWPYIREVVVVLGELEQAPSETTWTRSQLDAMETSIRHITETADGFGDNPAAYAPSPKACQYCARREGCPALSRDVLRTAEVVANNGPHTIAELTPAEIGDALRRFRPAGKLVADFVETLEKRAKELIASGATVPGWAAKESGGTREWLAPDDVVESAINRSIAEQGIAIAGGLDLRGLVSPAEAERRIAAALAGKDGAKSIASNAVKGLVKSGKRVSLVQVDETSAAKEIP